MYRTMTVAIVADITPRPLRTKADSVQKIVGYAGTGVMLVATSVMDVNPAMLFAYITGIGVLMGLSVAGAKHGDAIPIDDVVRREEAVEAE